MSRKKLTIEAELENLQRESKHSAVAEWCAGKNIPARAIMPAAGVNVLVESVLLLPLAV